MELSRNSRPGAPGKEIPPGGLDFFWPSVNICPMSEDLDFDDQTESLDDVREREESGGDDYIEDEEAWDYDDDDDDYEDDEDWDDDELEDAEDRYFDEEEEDWDDEEEDWDDED